MSSHRDAGITDVIGKMPYRMAFAGGWIDQWIRRLGQSGKDCFDAILAMDVRALGRSMNECMQCWAAILPRTVRHPTITVDLLAILGYYQSRYAGAMYSGCGGGYIYVVSEEPVPGSLRVKVRVAGK